MALDRTRAVMERIADGAIEKSLKGRYLHWDEVRRRQPPASLSLEEWWVGIKLHRGPARRVPLTDVAGRPFHFHLPDRVLAALHDITKRGSGQIEMQQEVTSPAQRDRYIVHSLFEEAITSSQLEGAATTSRVAREMLRTNRTPRNRGEQKKYVFRFHSDLADRLRALGA